jgi:hypothetical protein
MCYVIELSYNKEFIMVCDSLVIYGSYLALASYNLLTLVASRA